MASCSIVCGMGDLYSGRGIVGFGTRLCSTLPPLQEFRDSTLPSAESPFISLIRT